MAMNSEHEQEAPEVSGSGNDSVVCKFCQKTLAKEGRLCHELTCDKFYVLPKKSDAPSLKKTYKHCEFCGKEFGLRKNLKRHEKICNLNPDKSDANITCNLCGQSFNRKDNFKTHSKRCQARHLQQSPSPSTSNGEDRGSHSSDVQQPPAKSSCSTRDKPMMKSKKASTPCLQPGCNQEFVHKIGLIEHLKTVHGLAVEDPIHKQFDSWQQFKTWKSEEEEKTFSFFSQKSGQSAAKIKYMYCQHDGLRNSPRKGSRIVTKGRLKVGHFCIAKMQAYLNLDDKKIHVTYYPTHSHNCSPQDYAHHPMSDYVNHQINEKLSWGVSPSKVYHDVMDQQLPKTATFDQARNCKAVVLTKKRIRERARKLRARRRFHKDEAKSLRMMADKLMTEDDAVLLYKPYRHGIIKGPKEIDQLPGSENLFMLGIQTKRQAQLLTDHCHKVVLMDETHGTNHHGFQLLTLMVIDDNRRGWPVAHLLTSKSDAETLQYFFRAVHMKQPPETKVNCAVSDDDVALINGMVMGFGYDPIHILCKWHVIKNFKKNLRKYVPLDMVDDMMTALRVLVNEVDEEKFLILQEGFIKKYTEASPQSKKFIEDYYSNFYQHRAKKWAMCYRHFPHCHVNTTGHIESFHHRLKKAYLKRKVNRRLDDLVDILLKIERDDFIQRAKESRLGIAFNPIDIHLRHERSMHIKDEVVAIVDANSWEVKASTGKDLYHVEKYHSTCPSDQCFSTCSQISCNLLCSHMYCCSCPDNHPLCKHIHKVRAMEQHDVVKRVRDNELTVEESCDMPVLPATTHKENVTSDDFSASESVNSLTRRASSKFCRDLDGNIVFLSNILSSAEEKPNALAHAATMTNELILQLKYMSEPSDVAEIVEMEPTIRYNSNEVLKTQVSQLPSFKRPPKKRSAAQGRLSLSKRMAVVKDLLSAAGGFSAETATAVNFTPPLNFIENPRDIVLRCRSENISLMNLKTLEMILTEREKNNCLQYDPAFKTGWLSSCIINSYLETLAELHPSCLVLSSELSLRYARGFSNKSPISKSMAARKVDVILLPVNVTSIHWCIIAVHLSNPACPKICYYDPLQGSIGKSTENVLNLLRSDLNSILDVSSFENENDVYYVEAAKQTDFINCGVHICSFADQVVRKESYKLVQELYHFRKKIYNAVVGGCLKRQFFDEESCGVCKEEYSHHEKNSPELTSEQRQEDDEWLNCTRCDQFSHKNCLNTADLVVCPV